MRSDYPKRLVRFGLAVVMLLSIHDALKQWPELSPWRVGG